MTNFVVVHVGSEYNDEVYELADEGGVPVRVYNSKAVADEFAHFANGDELATIAPQDWGRELDDVSSLDSTEFDERISALLEEEITNAFNEVDFDKYEFTRVEKNELVEILDKLCFYIVYEVEDDKNSGEREIRRD